MAGVMDMVRALIGGGDDQSQPQSQVALAPQPKNYPTTADAEYAKKYDYSYGQPWAREFNDQSFRVLTGDPNQHPLQTQTVSDPGPLKDNNPMKDYYARAALAAQNSGLASLGFNPSRTAIDITHDPKEMNILGTYDKNNDDIYANARDPSTIVHESIHRGIHQLQGQPEWKPEFNEALDHHTNEMMVRALMQGRMGDHETENAGDIGLKQQEEAKGMFSQEHYRKLLEDMDMAASQYMARKHPGGPR